jgi:hypothetical protein
VPFLEEGITLSSLFVYTDTKRSDKGKHYENGGITTSGKKIYVRALADPEFSKAHPERP